MAADEGRAQGAQKASQLRWDRKKKRFTAGDQVGADNKKMIRSESGALLPATYNSGRFKDWQQKRRRGTAITGDSRSGDKGGPASGILPAQAIHRHRKQQEQVSRVLADIKLTFSAKRRRPETHEESEKIAFHILAAFCRCRKHANRIRPGTPSDDPLGLELWNCLSNDADFHP
jgi:hypothetical protein